MLKSPYFGIVEICTKSLLKNGRELNLNFICKNILAKIFFVKDTMPIILFIKFIEINVTKSYKHSL